MLMICSSTAGLDTLGVLGLMRQYPAQFLGTLVAGFYKPTAQQLTEMFEMDFSPQGSNRRTEEEQVYLNWTFYLNDIEGKQ
jgi:hypothetical protein